MMAKKTKRHRNSAPRMEYCDYCDGTGWVEGGKNVIMTGCPKCKGKGQVPSRYE